MEILNPAEEKAEAKTEEPVGQPPEPEGIPPGAEKPEKKGLSLGPVERIMAAIAAVAAVVLALVLVVSLPYMHRRSVDDDPEIYRDYGEAVSLPTPEETAIQEPTPEETAPGSRNAALDRNPYSRFDFQFTRHNYLKLQNVPSSVGVDVSQYQGDIDWESVRASGVEFAIIRLGLRGYGQEGRMREDTYARQNLAGAKAAGLKIGAYFFSQALSIHLGHSLGHRRGAEYAHCSGLGDSRRGQSPDEKHGRPVADGHSASFLRPDEENGLPAHGVLQLAPVGESVLPGRPGGLSLLAGSVSGADDLPLAGGNVAVDPHGPGTRHLRRRGYQCVYALLAAIQHRKRIPPGSVEPGGYLPFGTLYYRRRFFKPSAWSRNRGGGSASG